MRGDHTRDRIGVVHDTSHTRQRTARPLGTQRRVRAEHRISVYLAARSLARCAGRDGACARRTDPGRPARSAAARLALGGGALDDALGDGAFGGGALGDGALGGGALGGDALVVGSGERTDSTRSTTSARRRSRSRSCRSRSCRAPRAARAARGAACPSLSSIVAARLCEEIADTDCAERPTLRSPTKEYMMPETIRCRATSAPRASRGEARVRHVDEPSTASARTGRGAHDGA